MAKIIHCGNVRNGKLFFDLPKLWQHNVDKLDGKRFEIIIDKEWERPSKSQYGYYYAGIIRATCMKTTLFEGYSEDEIHETLLHLVRSQKKILVKKDGSEEITIVKANFRRYSRDEMATYINDVLNWLATEDIHPLAPERYAYDINDVEFKK